MKIKKVDDKPMVIHTKKKAKIHMHEPKKAKIKGSNIYTVQRGPKIASAKIQVKRSLIVRVPFIRQRRKKRNLQNLREIYGSPILLSRRRIPIFI